MRQNHNSGHVNKCHIKAQLADKKAVKQKIKYFFMELSVMFSSFVESTLEE